MRSWWLTLWVWRKGRPLGGSVGQERMGNGLLHLLPRPQPQPEGSSDPGSLSHGRRKELREMPSGGSCFMAAATQAEKCRWSGDALPNFIAVTCHSKAASAFQIHTTVSQALQHIWRALVASQHKAAQSAGSPAFRKAERQGIGPYCRAADLDLQKNTHLWAMPTKLYWVLTEPNLSLV